VASDQANVKTDTLAIAAAPSALRSSRQFEHRKILNGNLLLGVEGGGRSDQKMIKASSAF
jgi:hypothetical protein